jgi:hypothetical protein
VVLTVRKGWEEAWRRFVDDYTLDAPVLNPATGPYLSIAQEIAAFDDRNYPGIPPSNPAKAAVRSQDAVFTTRSSKIDQSSSEVTILVDSSAGLVVGLQVVVDIEDERHIQETTEIVRIPDGTHIVVQGLAHPHDGTATPFPVVQPGEKGTLVAEWFEYTSTSGTDIAMTSNLATIA